MSVDKKMFNFICRNFIYANLSIFCETLAIRRLQKYFEVVDAEDAVIAYLAALAGGEYLDIPLTAIKRVKEGNDVILEAQKVSLKSRYKRREARYLYNPLR